MLARTLLVQEWEWQWQWKEVGQFERALVGMEVRLSGSTGCGESWRERVQVGSELLGLNYYTDVTKDCRVTMQDKTILSR